MPDFQNFSITRRGSVTVPVPRYDISCDVCDSQSGSLIRSFRVTFPGVLQNFTDDQLKELFDQLIINAINMKLRDNVPD